jgi:hypothetical protein
VNPRTLLLTFKAQKRIKNTTVNLFLLLRFNSSIRTCWIKPLNSTDVSRPLEHFYNFTSYISPLQLVVIIFSQLRGTLFFFSLGRIILVFRTSLSKFRLFGFQIRLDRIKPSRFSHPFLITIVIFFFSHLGFRSLIAKLARFASAEIFEFDVVLVLHLLEKIGLGVLSIWLILVLTFVNDDYFLSSG